MEILSLMPNLKKIEKPDAYGNRFEFYSGVVENGIFTQMVDKVIIGTSDGIKRIVKGVIMPIPGGIPYDFKEIANKNSYAYGNFNYNLCSFMDFSRIKIDPSCFICNISTNCSSFNRNIHCLYSLFQKKQLLILKLFF